RKGWFRARNIAGRRVRSRAGGSPYTTTGWAAGWPPNPGGRSLGRSGPLLEIPLRDRMLRCFSLPEHGDDPPARAVVPHLDAVDPALEGLLVLRLPAAFVSAPGLHHVAEALGLARRL